MKPTEANMTAQRRASLGALVQAYGLALVVAGATAILIDERPPLLRLGWADGLATLVVFAFSRMRNNTSIYDPYWSVAPPCIALFWLALPEAQAGLLLRQMLVASLVLIWGARLTGSFWRGWPGLQHEDWRYRQLREQSGRLYWLVSLLGLHLMPTAMVFLGCLSLAPALLGEAPLGLWDLAGLGVTGGAIVLEATADAQLHRFVRSRPPPGAILDRGLWAWSRHPNYLGEMGFWWGLWLLGRGGDPTQAWTVVGPLCISLLFILVSVPLIEGRMATRRAGWAAYCRDVPALFPRPWRRSPGPRA